MNPRDTDYTAEELELLRTLQSRINIARAVLDARVSRGLSQEALGRAAGTKQSRISEIEGLKGNVRLETLDRVARALDLAIDLVPREQAAPQSPMAIPPLMVAFERDQRVVSARTRIWDGATEPFLAKVG